MFGLTQREQRWAAEQKAAEVLVALATTVIQATAQVRVAEAQTAAELIRMRDALAAKEAEIERLRAALEKGEAKC